VANTSMKPLGPDRCADRAHARGVRFPSGSERRFAITAVSEAVALQVEQSSSPTKWSASSVANATTVINTAFGLPSPFDLRFVDLTHYSLPGSDPSLTDADFTLSLHIGFFAGFMHESNCVIAVNCSRLPCRTFAGWSRPAIRTRNSCPIG